MKERYGVISAVLYFGKKPWTGGNTLKERLHVPSNQELKHAERMEQKGIQKGIQEKLMELVQKKLEKGQSVEQIAEALEEKPEYIEQLIQELENK